MANSIFNHPAFNIIGRPTMDDFLKRCSDRLGQFGLSQADINDAIKQACDFFNIPLPRREQTPEQIAREKHIDELRQVNKLAVNIMPA